ncbi:cobyrinate a,c-diamide synthase [Bacillus weihaiensis]|uniref:Cobyrinate a,c-diamide synthase n=1 Tax=Bacillus weihaiensis TaxID=1547283 RepID=A0A1L3MRW3_9BACI|nr:cobyrinate a,c-diamide synthase [Bacillus weihaiensis]APH05073.1 cobyrinic acid a,c-diamide synthase [Bacillus weihaiensis]
MTNHRLVIAGTGSGVGKTTFTIGLMAAFMKKGLTVQGFKCGPDYIDPSYHTAVTKRASRNLDSWMLPKETVIDIFTHGSIGADISIIEGVMGFFDGKNPKHNVGSTADISMITQSPVLLVVNCASMARSAAAIVKGFQVLSEGANIVGVIANKVGSEGHYKLVKTAIEQECGIPVVGYMKRELDIEIPERHLGLIPSIERGELDPFFQKLGDLVDSTVDMEQLFELAKAPTLQQTANPSLFSKRNSPSIKLGIAKDEAFNFYYPENLEILQSHGAELVFFSPIRDKELPNELDGIYLGGGFPEEYASKLAENKEMIFSVKQAIENGLPTLAECGGFMYLTSSITTTKKETYQMVDLIPGQVHMQTKLAALGYREITGHSRNFLLSERHQAKGHEFHYSTFHSKADTEFLHAYETKGMRGIKKEGYVKGNLVAGYTHFHFASCLEMVKRWIKACEEHKAYA